MTDLDTGQMPAVDCWVEFTDKQLLDIMGFGRAPGASEHAIAAGDKASRIFRDRCRTREMGVIGGEAKANAVILNAVAHAMFHP